MHIKTHTAAIPDGETHINNSAAKLGRMGFNPSRLEAVDRIKAVAAALISECEAIRDQKGEGVTTPGPIKKPRGDWAARCRAAH